MLFELLAPNNPDPPVSPVLIREYNWLSSFGKWVLQPFFVPNFIDKTKNLLEWDISSDLALDWQVGLYQVTAGKYYLLLGYLSGNGVSRIRFNENESTDLVIIPNPQLQQITFSLDLRLAVDSGGGEDVLINEVLLID